MTIIQIIDTFTFYGLDVIALAALTCILVQVCKVTVLKKLRKKLATFLPFVLGTVLYALYAGVCNMSAGWVLNNYVDVLEHGFSVGAISTLFYVAYEQFVREGKSVSAAHDVVSTLIEGYVPSERAEEAAKAICEALERDVTGNGAARIKEILEGNMSGNVSETDLKLLSKLIIETLAHINACNK